MGIVRPWNQGTRDQADEGSSRKQLTLHGSWIVWSLGALVPWPLFLLAQDLCKELPRPRMGRVREEVIRRALLDNAPFINEHDAIGDLAAKAHHIGHDGHINYSVP